MIKRLSIVILVLAAGLGISTVLYLCLRPRPSGPAPVALTTLEQGAIGSLLGGGAWRNLPFTLDEAHERDLTRCLELAKGVHSTVNGVSKFTAVEVRHELEALLEKRPSLFYAEYLLGLWHQINGDVERSREYYELSRDHAPVVLVQRFQSAEGEPATGLEIQRFHIECNRVENNSRDPSLDLQFFHLTSDGEGAIHCPVYDTVYRRSMASHPSGFRTEYPSLGWFESPARIGVLPDALVEKIEDAPGTAAE